MTHYADSSQILVFGVDLDVLLRRESGIGELVPNAVPRVLELCLSEIEARGLTESGICEFFLLYDAGSMELMIAVDRVAGAQTEVNSLKDAFSSGSYF